MHTLCERVGAPDAICINIRIIGENASDEVVGARYRVGG
jgi:hypothetical protein